MYFPFLQLSSSLLSVTLSDPYVKISIGGRHFGQTQYKPNTLSPVWNEAFTCHLLHLESPVLLQVMDYDDYNTDDPMGTAAIEINNLSLNTTTEFKRPLQNVGNVVAKGWIYVTLRLEVYSCFHVAVRKSKI